MCIIVRFFLLLFFFTIKEILQHFNLLGIASAGYSMCNYHRKEAPVCFPVLSKEKRLHWFKIPLGNQRAFVRAVNKHLCKTYSCESIFHEFCSHRIKPWMNLSICTIHPFRDGAPSSERKCVAQNKHSVSAWLCMDKVKKSVLSCQSYPILPFKARA